MSKLGSNASTRHTLNICSRSVPSTWCPCFFSGRWSILCHRGRSSGLGWWFCRAGNPPDSSSTPRQEHIGTVSLAYRKATALLRLIQRNVTLRNPVGVTTLGCTWEVQAPSHLLTDISPLQVLSSLPNSSNSSLERVKSQTVRHVTVELQMVKSTLPTFYYVNFRRESFAKFLFFSTHFAGFD